MSDAENRGVEREFVEGRTTPENYRAKMCRAGHDPWTLLRDTLLEMFMHCPACSRPLLVGRTYLEAASFTRRVDFMCYDCPAFRDSRDPRSRRIRWIIGARDDDDPVAARALQHEIDRLWRATGRPVTVRVH